MDSNSDVVLEIISTKKDAVLVKFWLFIVCFFWAYCVRDQRPISLITATHRFCWIKQCIISLMHILFPFPLFTLPPPNSIKLLKYPKNKITFFLTCSCNNLNFWGKFYLTHSVPWYWTVSVLTYMTFIF